MGSKRVHSGRSCVLDRETAADLGESSPIEATGPKSGEAAIESANRWSSMWPNLVSVAGASDRSGPTPRASRTSGSRNVVETSRWAARFASPRGSRRGVGAVGIESTDHLAEERGLVLRGPGGLDVRGRGERRLDAHGGLDHDQAPSSVLTKTALTRRSRPGRRGPRRFSAGICRRLSCREVQRESEGSRRAHQDGRLPHDPRVVLGRLPLGFEAGDREVADARVEEQAVAGDHEGVGRGDQRIVAGGSRARKSTVSMPIQPAKSKASSRFSGIAISIWPTAATRARST